jgi:hypothetical protein
MPVHPTIKGKDPTMRSSMSATLALLAVTLMSSAALSAEESKPLEPGPWKFTTLVGLNLSESGFSSNWAGGDKGSIVWTLNSNSRLERQFNRSFNLTNMLQLAYGQTTRQQADPNNPNQLVWDIPDKTTDQLAFESVGRFTMDRAVDPYMSFKAESQFEDQSNPIGTLTLNPVKLKEALGLARVFEKKEDREAITRIGLGVRQTFGRSFVNPPTTETASFSSNDGGVEWQTTALWPMLEKKVIYKGSLLVFQPLFYSKAGALEDFDRAAMAADPTRSAVAEFWKATDVNFQNTFTTDITKYLSVNLVAQLVYDKFDTAANVDNSLALPVLISEVDRNVRKAGQFKETLAIGLTYKMF